MAFLEWSYYGNTLRAWILALLIASATYTALQILKHVLARQVHAFADRTSNRLDDLLASLVAATRPFAFAVIATFAATRFLYLADGAAQAFRAAIIIGLALQAGLWGNAAVVFLSRRYLEHNLADDPGAVTTMRFLGLIGRIGIWTLIALLTLQNAFKIEITALVAGLGVGGIAVALAVQNILGDLFASLSIVLDKPFVFGDFIIVGDAMGTVEHVGLKTTRVRSLSGEQIIFSNTDLLQSRVRNFKRMYERRIVFSLGVTYDTPRETLATLPAVLREVIEARDRTRFDRAHFKAFGDSSLDFEIVYYVLDPDFNLYMDIQQTINLEIFRRFQELGVDFAFPTRTLHLHNGLTAVAGAALASDADAVPATAGD